MLANPTNQTPSYVGTGTNKQLMDVLIAGIFGQGLCVDARQE